MLLLYVLLGLVVLWYLYRWAKETQQVPNKSEKHVYITGCDSGFGYLLARHLDKRGFHVIAGCYTEKGEDELKKITSDRFTAIHLDVTNTDSLSKAAAVIKTLVGEKGLWAVVNNAGVSVPFAPSDWLTINDFKSMLDVNLNGVIGSTLSVLPLIKKARGRVVNIASVLGRISPYGGPYSVSKYGVESFNDSLRINMAPFGVKVLCIEPGYFRTAVTDIGNLKKSVQGLWDKLPQDVKDDYGSDFVGRAFDKLEERIPMMVSKDLMKVVSCMEHAVSAVHPRSRYSPGWDAKLFWLPLSYMPSWISDRVFLIDSVKPKISIL